MQTVDPLQDTCVLDPGSSVQGRAGRQTEPRYPGLPYACASAHTWRTSGVGMPVVAMHNQKYRHRHADNGTLPAETSRVIRATTNELYMHVHAYSRPVKKKKADRYMLISICKVWLNSYICTCGAAHPQLQSNYR